MGKMNHRLSDEAVGILQIPILASMGVSRVVDWVMVKDIYTANKKRTPRLYARTLNDKTVRQSFVGKKKKSPTPYKPTHIF